MQYNHVVKYMHAVQLINHAYMQQYKRFNNTGCNNLKRNQDTNIENFKMWIKTKLYFRYSCINEKIKTLIPAYVVS